VVGIDQQRRLYLPDAGWATGIRQRRDAVELVACSDEGRGIKIVTWVGTLDDVTHHVVERVEVVVAAGEVLFRAPRKQAEVHALR
jgi:hypothetical protein